MSLTQNGNDGGTTVVVTQPPHFPNMYTRDLVESYVAFGLDEEQIAVCLRCTVNDVKLHYAQELEHGLARVNARVQAALLHQALHKEDVAAMTIWLINKAGWRKGDGNRTNILNAPPGAGGEPVDGAMTVVQKREVLTRILTIATRNKRNEERVIDAEIVEPKRTNGSGHGGANGTKHR